MGLFGKKNKDEKKDEVKGAPIIEPIGENNSELQDLLSEFRQMRAGIETQEKVDETIEPVVEEENLGEEYEVSEEESESIENFLSGNEEEVIEETPIEEEVVEEIPAELNEEEIIEDEVLDEEIEEFDDEEVISEDEELEDDRYSTNEDVAEIDAEEISPEEIIEDNEEPITEEPIEVEVNISDPEEYHEEVEEDEIGEEAEEIENETIYSEEEPEIKDEVQVAEEEPSVSNAEIDKKFEEFEKRLLDKIMQQFASMQVQNVVPAQQQSVSQASQTQPVASDDNIEVSTVNGNLVINGFVFTGEVVMFTPLDNIKQATWEEVVRRKGHCTYHLTTSGNGGWFIKKSNAPNPFAYIEIKEEAEELAKFYAKKEKAELKIHNAKGVIEKSLSFGREKLRG